MVVGIVINPMRESIPFTKAPDQGVGVLMWSAQRVLGAPHPESVTITFRTSVLTIHWVGLQT